MQPEKNYNSWLSWPSVAILYTSKCGVRLSLVTQILPPRREQCLFSQTVTGFSRLGRAELQPAVTGGVLSGNSKPKEYHNDPG